MTTRPDLRVVGDDITVKALQALRMMRLDYGLPKLGKPCVAYVLDGNLGAAIHKAAFIIALECRDLGCDEKEAIRILTRWAPRVEFRQSRIPGIVRSAYATVPGGAWKYHAAGVTKRPGSHAHEVLAGTCETLGCPANCPAFEKAHRGPGGEGVEQFELLGWPGYLKRKRHGVAIDVYRALCEFEGIHGFAHGSQLRISYRVIAKITGRSDASSVGDNLDRLLDHGLLAEFVRGSGSGPHAHDRQASIVSRCVPVPPVPIAAIKTGGVPPPKIGGSTPPEIGGGTPSHIGGLPEITASPDEQA
jgi:hypothetical protein